MENREACYSPILELPTHRSKSLSRQRMAKLSLVFCLSLFVLYYAIDCISTSSLTSKGIKDVTPDNGIVPQRELANYINGVVKTNRGGCQCNNVTYNCECQVKVSPEENNYVSYKISSDVAVVVVEELRKYEEALQGQQHTKALWPPSEPYVFEDERLSPLTGREEPLSHMHLMPHKESQINTSFLLYYPWSRSEGVPVNFNERSIVRREGCERLFVVVHGFRDSSDSEQMVLIKESILSYFENESEKACVLTVDWRNGASIHPYSVASGAVYGQAAANTIVVGKQTGLLLFDIVRLNRLDPQSIHLIGFSLGAHVMHFAGRTYTEFMTSGVTGNPRQDRKVGRITGLDPAARHFQRYKDAFLEKNDANFVDIIHTSVTYHEGNYIDTLNARYGNPDATGHVDFYPNGGDAPQPECKEAHSPSTTTVEPPVSSSSRFSSSAANSSSFSCSHNRAIYFFSDSFNRSLPRDKFLSVPCDSMANLTQCRSRVFDDKDTIAFRTISSMGFDSIFFHGRGKQFLSFDHTD